MGKILCGLGIHFDSDLLTLFISVTSFLFCFFAYPPFMEYASLNLREVSFEKNGQWLYELLAGPPNDQLRVMLRTWEKKLFI